MIDVTEDSSKYIVAMVDKNRKQVVPLLSCTAKANAKAIVTAIPEQLTKDKDIKAVSLEDRPKCFKNKFPCIEVGNYIFGMIIARERQDIADQYAELVIKTFGLDLTS